MINEQFIDRVINVLIEMRLDERNRANRIAVRNWQRQQGEKLGGGASTPEWRNKMKFGSKSDQGPGKPKSPKQDDQETEQRQQSHRAEQDTARKAKGNKDWKNYIGDWHNKMNKD